MLGARGATAQFVEFQGSFPRRVGFVRWMRVPGDL
jgi:hypothetical protein